MWKKMKTPELAVPLDWQQWKAMLAIIFQREVLER